MALKTYEPKEGIEGLVIEGFVTAQVVQKKDGVWGPDRKPGESFVVRRWPYATSHPGEQAFLDQHALVQEHQEQPKSAKDQKNDGADSKEGGE